MTYDPSPEAVEVMARALCAHDGLDWDEALRPGWDGDTDAQQYAALAEAALIALMGATVPQPCATCGNIGIIADAWDMDSFSPCPEIHAPPRSLAVRECETAGALEPIYAGMVLDGGTARVRLITEKLEGEFREVPPTPGEDDQ